ncbi:hypothetical protein [Pseudomonas sichuanensis]|uniref:hypothetical protein n=1 Tax=Pseudomonas sichuanensis TaxID=2213015 RepID=UPI002AB81DA1|nr:hypothetical protein [Pseudomonas sichuanensis]MDZ4021429.1 hypothetical protein [Pseudomonas sichuanensis]
MALPLWLTFSQACLLGNLTTQLLPFSCVAMGVGALLVLASPPKTLVFFCAFLPQFLEPGWPIFSQFAAMYLNTALIVCLVQCGDYRDRRCPRPDKNASRRGF